MMKESVLSTTCLVCGVILTAVTLILQPVGACLRSAQPAAVENISGEVDVVTPAPTSNLEDQPCTPEQSTQLTCYNDGECIQRINLADDSVSLLCQCTYKYKGKQCEKRNRDTSMTVEDDPGAVAGIIAGLIVALILVIVVVVVCRMKSSREQRNAEMINNAREQQHYVNGTENGFGCHDNPAGPTEKTPATLVSMNYIGEYQNH